DISNVEDNEIKTWAEASFSNVNIAHIKRRPNQNWGHLHFKSADEARRFYQLLQKKQKPIVGPRGKRYYFALGKQTEDSETNLSTTSNTMESLSFVNNEVATTSNTMKLLSFVNEPTTLITDNNNDKVATTFHNNNEVATTSNTIELLSFVNVEENGYGYDLYDLSDQYMVKIFVPSIQSKDEIDAYISIEDDGVYLLVKYHIESEYDKEAIVKKLLSGSISIKIRLPA
ncbi:10799_t:CDS:2, partial [Scutellospora calospora]